MVYTAEFLIVMTDLLKSVRIGARNVPRLHGHKRLDGDAIGRYSTMAQFKINSYVINAQIMVPSYSEGRILKIKN